MSRLPTPGSDQGTWGTILNDFLSQSLASDGTLKTDSVGSDQLQDDAVTAAAIAPGSITKSDVGLANVDDTSDANKPVSTATQTALNTKLTATSNLSDLASASTARTNLGLGSAATMTPTSLAADAALKSAFARPAGQSIVLIGDSLTANNGGTSIATPVQPLGAPYDSKGIFNWANVMLRHAFRVIGNAGIGGQSSSQIAARFSTDVVAYNPDWVFILAGTNDTSSSANTTTHLASMYDQASNAGIRVIACTIPPNTNAGLTQRQWYLTVNRWIREQARVRKGFIMADIGAAIYDTATTWQAISGMLAADNVHPSPQGAAAMGKIVADAVRAHLPLANDMLGSSSGDPENLLSNPMLTGTGSTAPTGWAKGGSSTLSYVPRTDGVAGSWCQVANASGAGSNLTSNVSIGASLAIGDVVYAVIEFEVDSLETSAPANSQTLTLKLQFYNGSSFFASASDVYWDSSYSNIRYPGTSGILQTPPITVPATTTIAQIVASGNGGGNYRFHRAAIRKVSAGAII